MPTKGSINEAYMDQNNPITSLDEDGINGRGCGDLIEENREKKGSLSCESRRHRSPIISVDGALAW